MNRFRILAPMALAALAALPAAAQLSQTPRMAGIAQEGCRAEVAQRIAARGGHVRASDVKTVAEPGLPDNDGVRMTFTVQTSDVVAAGACRVAVDVGRQAFVRSVEITRFERI
jgi:hypothetical protein